MYVIICNLVKYIDYRRFLPRTIQWFDVEINEKFKLFANFIGGESGLSLSILKRGMRASGQSSIVPWVDAE